MQEIKNKLLELKDEKYRKFNSKLCPDTNHKMLGIRVPILKKIAKDILKEEINWQEFVKTENVQYFEELLLQGLIIGYSTISFSEKLKYIEIFVSRIDSWAITDTFVPTLKIKKENLDEYWNFILKFINSEKEFEIRFALISMLDYYIIDGYIDKVIKKIDGIHHEGYYVKMGVAWIVAEIAIKYNQKAMNYLKSNNLDKFTHNKAIQKMLDSYRISSNQKDILRNLKRK